MRLLCLSFPRLGTALARKANPELTGRPIVLIAGEGDAALVSGASAEAAACGVSEGMLAAGARSRCPHAAFLPDNAAECLRTVEQVRSVLLVKATLAVAIGGRDHLFVDLAELDGRLADEHAAAAALAGLARSWSGHEVRAGVAGTRAEALRAARTARRLPVIVPDNGEPTERIAPWSGEAIRARESWEAPLPASEVRVRLARVIRRLQTILSARSESFREIRLVVGNGASNRQLLLSSRDPMHRVADVMALLAARVSDDDLSDALTIEVEFRRLGPSVTVQPVRRESAAPALALPVRPIQRRLLRAG